MVLSYTDLTFPLLVLYPHINRSLYLSPESVSAKAESPPALSLSHHPVLLHK